MTLERGWVGWGRSWRAQAGPRGKFLGRAQLVTGTPRVTKFLPIGVWTKKLQALDVSKEEKTGTSL